jgi:hypothetical protein
MNVGTAATGISVSINYPRSERRRQSVLTPNRQPTHILDGVSMPATHAETRNIVFHKKTALSG